MGCRRVMGRRAFRGASERGDMKCGWLLPRAAREGRWERATARGEGCSKDSAMRFWLMSSTRDRRFPYVRGCALGFVHAGLAASHPNLLFWLEENAKLNLMQQYAGGRHCMSVYTLPKDQSSSCGANGV
eukprot:6204562-Pleurochrysis_carterae.AAC.3